MQQTTVLEPAPSAHVSRPEPSPPPPQHYSSNKNAGPPRSIRNHLPDERNSVTHKFNIGNHEGYFTVGLYRDGRPGELFIVMAKEGSTVSGLINSFAQAISIGLQYGVPLELFCDKFSHTRFEPCGWTGNPEIAYATSVMDFIFRWLRNRFVDRNLAATNASDVPFGAPPLGLPASAPPLVPQATEPTDAPSCRTCGSLTRRNGSCYVCAACGWTSGCG